MRGKAGPVAAAALALLLASEVIAGPPAKKPQRVAPVLPNGDAQAGSEKAEAGRCFECHGADGQGVDHGNATAVFARLAGQHSAYLVKQLRDFKSGARQHDVMRVMARHLEDEDQRDIAAYFSALPAMRSPAPAAPSTAASAGASLYTQGAVERALPACSHCHGATAPLLAGQDARYLEQQLLDWRSGWRRNSQDGAMNQVARALSDADIRALAAYLAAAPPTSP